MFTCVYVYMCVFCGDSRKGRENIDSKIYFVSVKCEASIGIIIIFNLDRNLSVVTVITFSLVKKVRLRRGIRNGTHVFLNSKCMLIPLSLGNGKNGKMFMSFGVHFVMPSPKSVILVSMFQIMQKSSSVITSSLNL